MTIESFIRDVFDWDITTIAIYIWVPLIVSVLLGWFMPYIARKLSKRLPSDKNQLKIIKGVEKNKALIRSLQKYGFSEIWIMVIFWLIFMIIPGIILMNPSQPFGFGGFLILFVLIISGLGPSWYITRFLMIGILKIMNPKFDKSIMNWYYYNAFAEQSPAYLTNLAKKFDYVRLNNILAVWFSSIYAIFLLFAWFYSLIV